MKRARLISEEDVRTKIVSTWLLDHGIGYGDIHFEYSFSIRLGRQKFLVESGKISRISDGIPKTRRASPVLRPRSDILVRNSEGKNLLIIEVKAPGETIDDTARDQGISYARLLDDIPPFVLVTNGYDAKIFDSITKGCIDGQTIPLNHPYVRAGFKVEANDIPLRSEALENLVSLSEENLITICSAQSFLHMQRLRSIDLDSGKRYIPSIFVERVTAKNRMLEFLDRKRSPLVILTGPPQTGKTNFTCHLVEDLLEQHKPCFFYAAVDLKDGLFRELGQDLEWMIGDSNRSANYIQTRISKILDNSDKKLTIFVDGLNEGTSHSLKEINYDINLMRSSKIQIVVTFTYTAAGRLLTDATGNPSWIADVAGINDEDIEFIKVADFKACAKREKPVVSLSSFSNQERSKAYELYSTAYNVKVPRAHQMEQDPFLIGLAFRLNKNSNLPRHLDGPELLEKWILEKAKRSGLVEGADVRRFLSELAFELYRTGSPVSESCVGKIWGLSGVQKLPDRLFESSLITRLSGVPDLIDFSTESERSFAIAYWVNHWHEHTTFERLDAELEAAVGTSIGIETVRWFFKQSQHIVSLRDLVRNPFFRSGKVNELWLSSSALADQISHDPVAFEYLTTFFFEHKDYAVQTAAGRMLDKISIENPLVSNFTNAQFVKQFIDHVVSVHRTHRLDGPGGIRMLDILDDLALSIERSEHAILPFWNYLKKLLSADSEDARGAVAIIMRAIDPWHFLQVFAGEIGELKMKQIEAMEFKAVVEDACDRVFNHLDECYDLGYDEICVEELQEFSAWAYSAFERILYYFRDCRDMEYFTKLWKLMPEPASPWYQNEGRQFGPSALKQLTLDDIIARNSKESS